MSGRAGRTTAVYFISQVVSSVAGFFATWFIANRLGSTILGEYSVVVALLFWLNVPASAIGKATNKRVSEEGEFSGYVSASHLLNAAVTGALTVGVLLADDQINALANGRQVAIFLVVLIAAQGVFDIVVESLRGTKQVGRSGILKAFERIIRSASQIAVIIVGFGFIWLIIGHTASLAIAAVIGIIALRRLPTIPKRKHIDRLIEYARYSWLGTLKTRAFAWMDTLILGGFAAYGTLGIVGVTHSQIGIYEAAWSVASVLGLVGVSIKQTLFPELSDLGSSENYEEVRHFLNEALAFTGLFVIPGLFGVVAIGGDLLTVYGDEFAQGKQILIILVASRLLAAYSTQLVSTINAIDRPDVAFRINGIFLGFNLVGNIVLVALFGWYGAAVATTLSAGVSTVFGAYLLRELVGAFSVPYREIGMQVFAAVVMFTVVMGIKAATPTNLIVTFALVLLGALIYGVVLLTISKRLRKKAQSFVPVGT